MKQLPLFCSILVLVLATACQPVSSVSSMFTDISSEVRSTRVLPSEPGNYFYPVWVTDQKVVFLVVPFGQNYFLDIPPNEPNLQVYDVTNQTWEKKPLDLDPDCRRGVFYFLQRLPNQRLGFVEVCRPYDSTQERRIIREMDITTGQSSTLVESSPGIREIGRFSFSDDMSEVIQEDMANHILSNKLFYRGGETLIQIVPDFVRAAGPAWSPHARQIAFWGTEDYYGKKPDDFTSLSDIGGLALYPWDLYISTPEGTQLHKVLSSVQSGLPVKWSPTENVIAFSGIYQNTPGLWLLDPNSLEVTRIWSIMGDYDFFDWSPDGSKLIILNSQIDEQREITNQDLNIVHLK